MWGMATLAMEVSSASMKVASVTVMAMTQGWRAAAMCRGRSACGRRVGVCDDAAEALLLSAWPDAEVIRTSAPDASDALRFSLPRLRAREFVDLALLDGHYLRRSDAEIFGEAAKVAGA
jgi:hypothetical protein